MPYSTSQLQAVGHELVDRGDAETPEHGGGAAAALLTGHEHLGAGLALGIAELAVLLHDQRRAQRDHHQHAQHAAAQGDQADLHDGGHVAKSLRRPHKQGRHRENRARGHGLTGRADGLDHVVLQNGVPLEDEADGAHREHRRRDGGGDRHADAQTEVGIGAAEHDGQQRAEYHGEHGEFRHNLVRRDIGLEFLLFHVLLLFLLYYRALRIRTDTFHFTKNITESQVKLHFSPYNLFLILLIFNRAIY